MNSNNQELKQKVNQILSQNNNQVSFDNLLEILFKKDALSSLLEKIINIIMLAERDVYLNNNSDVKNGFSPKILNTQFDKLELSVPRTRYNNFRPSILPEKYKRTDDSFVNFIKTLIAAGNSKSDVISILKQNNLSFSENIYEQISEQIETNLNDFKTKELPKEMAFVYIDGYHCEIKDIDIKQVKKACIYVVIGINFEGNKQILGFYTVYGEENKSEWLKIFHDMVNRKLEKILMIICDDFNGISDAISAIYPKTYIQKCFIHCKRNIKRNLGKEDAKTFIKEMNIIKESKSYEEAKIKFEKLCEEYSERYKRYMEMLKSKTDELFAFMKFPEEVRKYIYTTNTVENFNSLIEKERIKIGGYFQSLKIAERVIYLKIEHLHNHVFYKSNPMIKSKKYELYQIFQLTFEK